MTNQLAETAKETGLDSVKTQVLMEQFADFFEKANEFETAAKDIVVTDELQTEQIAKAKLMRHDLTELRLKTEKRRKSLKEQSLREGKAIDGVANIIKAVIVPTEEYLVKQEKFAEVKRKERQAKIEAERSAELGKYVEDLTLYNLGEMPDDVFDRLLESSREAIKAKEEAEAKAEADRIAKETTEREERERIHAENAKLKAEADAREAQMQRERQEAAEKQRAFDEENARKRRAIEGEKAQIEAERNAAIEERAEQEKEARAKLEAEALAKAEEERQAKLAPDKHKLVKYSEEIEALARHPKGLNSDKAREIEAHVKMTLMELGNFIRNKAMEL